MKKSHKKLPSTKLNALVWQEDDLFVAKCLEVEVTSQGKTQQTALKNLEEALDLFFEDDELRVKSTYKNPQVFPLSYA